MKRYYSKALVGAMNRVDFLGIVDRIVSSKEGAKLLERFSDMPSAWPQLDRLKSLAVDLTLEQMRGEGHEQDRASAAERVELVAPWYDLEIHRSAAAAVTLVMNHLFVQQDPSRPFVSPDGRDLAHLDELRRYREQGLGVIYLVNHSSHLDEFLLDCLLVNIDMGLPLFAAGANMMAIKSLAKLLMCGSYVVQRRGADRLGLAALYNFCRAITRIGGQQAIFLEAWHGGARSRDGSLRYPRRLVTLRGAMDTNEEAVIQPVAISYTAIPEDLPLAARQGARSWVRGMGFWPTLGRAFVHPKSFLWRSVKGIYGRAYVTFSKPILLSELKRGHEADRGGMALDEFAALTAIREIARSKKIMSSQLVARGVSRMLRTGESDLGRAVDREKELIEEYHQGAFGQEPDMEDFIAQNDPQAVVADGLGALRKRGVLKGRRSSPEVASEAGLAFYATHGDRRIYSPTADQNLVVVGANDWGFALTYLVGHRILEEKRYLNASLTLFDSRSEVAAEMGVMRHPPGRFQEYRLPKNAFVTADAPSAFRKASEVILASSPDSLEEKARLMLKHSEQSIKVVVVTSGFEPQSRRLPCQVVADLAREMGRDDVEIYALVGPVSEAWLVEGKPATGVLAGPLPGRDALADLFNWPPVSVLTRPDPVGNQAAACLARIYALWGNFLGRSEEIASAADVGHFIARTAGEAAGLGLAWGGRPETFAADSPAWIANFIAEGLAGRGRQFARKLRRSLTGTKDPGQSGKRVRKLVAKEGGGVVALQDLKCAYEAAKQAGIDPLILGRAYKAFFGDE